MRVTFPVPLHTSNSHRWILPNDQYWGYVRSVSQGKALLCHSQHLREPRQIRPFLLLNFTHMKSATRLPLPPPCGACMSPTSLQGGRCIISMSYIREPVNKTSCWLASVSLSRRVKDWYQNQRYLLKRHAQVVQGSLFLNLLLEYNGHTNFKGAETYLYMRMEKHMKITVHALRFYLWFNISPISFSKS